jgi:hypothetical protein
MPLPLSFELQLGHTVIRPRLCAVEYAAPDC